MFGLRPVLRNATSFFDRRHFLRPFSEFAGAHHSPVTSYLWRQRMAAKESEDSHKDKFPVDPESKLLTKPPSATRTTVRYNFSTDPSLADTYRNPWGFVRHGLLLEDLDALAGNTAAVHCSDGDSTTEGPMLVTASVDNVRMQNRLDMDKDLTLTGSVAWVGTCTFECFDFVLRSTAAVNLVVPVHIPRPTPHIQHLFCPLQWYTIVHFSL